MQVRWVSVTAALVLAGTLGSVATVGAIGPSMSSAWLTITIDQDECIRRGTASMRDRTFTTRFEILQNASIFGERGDYTALVRCAADKRIVYFVVAGPKGEICSGHMNAIRENF